MSPDPSASRAGSVQIGDRSVHRLGLGTNRLVESAPARAMLERALELGVDFVDTADVYQSGASEGTLGATLGGRAREIVIATKGGMTRSPTGRAVDGRPEHLRQAVEDSLRRLGIDCIELYQLHRPDPALPIETSVGALREMQQSGRIRRIGLCNVTVDEIERARRVASIVSVQNRFNVLERQSEDVLNYCEHHAIAFLPYTPLVRGDLSRASTVREMAAARGVTPHQLALSWLLRRSPIILPIPGTLSVAHLEENLAAADIELSDEEFLRLSA